jgi:hypothetical protein
MEMPALGKRGTGSALLASLTSSSFGSSSLAALSLLVFSTACKEKQLRPRTAVRCATNPVGCSDCTIVCSHSQQLQHSCAAQLSACILTRLSI